MTKNEETSDQTTNGTAATAMPSEPTIDQVKELLFGRESRDTNERFELIGRDMQAMEDRIDEKLANLNDALNASEKAQSDALESRISDVGDAMVNLGKSILGIAKSK